MKTKFTLNEINEMLPATQSWNGKNLVSSSPVEIRSMYADSYYIIMAGNKTISLPESKGFWLDGGIELFPDKIIPGVSKVYVKEGDKVILKKVESIKLVNEFIEYDYLCNTSNHNYLLNDFLLHNYDLQELVQQGVIGCGNWNIFEDACENGCDHTYSMYDNYLIVMNARRTAGINFLKEAIGNAFTPFSSTTALKLIDFWNEEYTPAFDEMQKAYVILFNSLFCDDNPYKRTGVHTILEYLSHEWVEGTNPGFLPQTPGEVVTGATVYLEADFGNGIFTEELYSNALSAQELYSEVNRRFVQILYGETNYPADCNSSQQASITGRTILNSSTNGNTQNCLA